MIKWPLLYNFTQYEIVKPHNKNIIWLKNHEGYKSILICFKAMKQPVKCTMCFLLSKREC